MAEYSINKFTFNGNTYKLLDETSGFSKVSISRKTTSGTNIADITIDGTTTQLYAPTGGGGTGTVTSVGVSNDTNGGLSVSGSPVTSSGTITIGHSNVLTSAQTTQAVYPIKIDKNGHISAYGSAVTIPTTASDVGAATSSHTHGTINNDGSVTSTIGDWDSGDAIAVIDATNNQIKKGPIKQNSSSVFLNGLGNWATPSDEKLSVSPVSDTNTYYPILSATSSAGTATRYVNSSFGFGSTSSTAGISIGSSSQDATLQMYANGKIVAIKGNTSTSANREITLPNAGGTVALTSDIPDVSGKIDTAGTGLSKSGTTLNHSNSITATTTQAVYPIKIDAQGHISEYGLSVAIPGTDELFGIVNYISSNFEDVVEAYDIYGEKILCRTNAITHVGYARLTAVEKDANDDITQFTFSLSEKGDDGNHPYDIEYNHRFIIDETNGWSYEFKQLSTASNLRNSGLYEVLMLLDTSSDLYTDIVALGWDSDVITT